MPRKPKAPSVEKRAKTTGATGPHLSPARQALRDSLMVTRRGQGWSNAQIAAEAGVHVRTVTRVLNERDVLGDDLINREPTDTVKRMAVQFESAAADLGSLGFLDLQSQRVTHALTTFYTLEQDADQGAASRPASKREGPTRAAQRLMGAASASSTAASRSASPVLPAKARSRRTTSECLGFACR